MWIIKNKNIFFSIACVLMIGSLVGFFVRGFNIGIEFTGGSLLEVSYSESVPDIAQVKESLATLDFETQAQSFGETGFIIRSKDITEAQRREVMTALVIDEKNPQLERFNSIGPSIGRELARKAIIALVLVMLGIIIYVAFAFRNQDEEETKNPGPSGWKYGFFTIAALFHDVLIPTGIFVWLGLEINTLFVVGLLSILGLSVNDTIVVFDRIREGLNDERILKKRTPFAELVGKSIVKTFGRSINTSLTLFLVSLALYVVGPVATRDLALVMTLGTFFGTYSSIFLASPLLVATTREKSNE